MALTKGQAFGDAGSARIVSWPPFWRLPSHGEAIVIADFGGTVESLAWDIEHGLVRIRLR